jgi:hypothetical protein
MIDLAAALRIDPDSAEGLDLPARPTGLVLCEDGETRTTLAADLSLVELLGYLDLLPGETITLHPEAFARQRPGWPSPAEIRGVQAITQQPPWISPTSRPTIARKARVELLIRCLDHYARNPASGSHDEIASEVQQVLTEIGVQGIQVEDLVPSDGIGESDYYDVSLRIFRVLADREGERDALEIALAASRLPDEPNESGEESGSRTSTGG